jgi:hypothetical protein
MIIVEVHYLLVAKAFKSLEWVAVKEEELLLGPLIVLSDLSLQPTVSVP